MNVLHDLAVWICTRQRTLDLKAGILHSSPALLHQEFRAEGWNNLLRTSILGRILLRVGGVHRGHACGGLQAEWGGDLLVCGALLHQFIAIKEQTGSCRQRQSNFNEISAALTKRSRMLRLGQAGKQEETSLVPKFKYIRILSLQIKDKLSQFLWQFLSNFVNLHSESLRLETTVSIWSCYHFSCQLPPPPQRTTEPKYRNLATNAQPTPLSTQTLCSGIHTVFSKD